MKIVTSLIYLIAFFSISPLFGQDASTKMSFSKDSLIGTWRACGLETWDEEADTLRFRHSTPNCHSTDCGEHNWSFRESGSVEFIYTYGCQNGFNSVSKRPKRWLFNAKENRLKFITNDGYVEYYDIIKLDDELILVHRWDLE